MNKKKLLTVAMVLSMIAVVAIGGTLAYFTDYDYNTNVMTIGNVKIDQIEQERNRDENGYPIDGMKEYEDGRPLYPIVTTEDGIDDKNLLDKYVTVKNTGNSPAFIRTLFAFEMGQIFNEEGELVEVVDLIHDYINLITDEENGSGMDFGISGGDIVIDVDGVPYHVACVLYNGNTVTDTEGEKKSALNPGETSWESLQNFYLKSEAGNEFYDMVGEEYKILVLSQAVQTEGFSDAFEAFKVAYGDGTTHFGLSAELCEGWFNQFYGETEAGSMDHSHGDSAENIPSED